MNPDIVLHKGDAKRPVVIFIHGLGMDKHIWTNPSESAILGGNLPINVLLSQKPEKKYFGYSKKKPSAVFPAFTAGEYPDKLQTSFDDLRAKGYPVLTWSQTRPVGPIDTAVKELAALAGIAAQVSREGIILIGHSRGGLIARQFLMNTGVPVKGLITICTPHKGSSIARLASYIKPLAALIAPLVSDAKDKGMLKVTMKRIIDFLTSRALLELLPDSDFFKSFHDVKREGVYCMTIGGTSPSLFRLYRWKMEYVMEDPEKRWVLVPEEIISIPEIFEKIVPAKVFPLELKKGRGDGLVTAESSKIDWCTNHYDFTLNHAEALFDPDVRKTVADAVDRINSP